MTTDIIDSSFHLSAFPAGNLYTGKGTVVGNTQQNDNSDTISGFFTSTGNATQVNVGFLPTVVEVINWTDGLQWKWMYGAPATDTIKITDGTPAIATDTGSAILVGSDPAGNVAVTLSATLCGTTKVLSFRIVA